MVELRSHIEITLLKLREAMESEGETKNPFLHSAALSVLDISQSVLRAFVGDVYEKTGITDQHEIYKMLVAVGILDSGIAKGDDAQIINMSDIIKKMN